MFNTVFRRIALGTLLLMVSTVPNLLANGQVTWSHSIQESMAEAEKTGKPLMMDFYTDW